MKRFILSEEGASVVEYGMIIGLLALPAFVFLRFLALMLKIAMFQIFWRYLWW